MGWTVALVVLGIVVLVVLLRGPVGELRKRRDERRRARKRQWRRDRDAARERRRQERAMNPVRAAARQGPPRWQQVQQRSGGKCWLCGTRTHADDRRRATDGREQLGATYPVVDFIVPVDSGGSYAFDNARIVHRHCRDLRANDRGRSQYGPPRRTFEPGEI